MHDKFENVRERAGEFAESARDMVGEVAGSAVQRSKQFLEVTKLNLANATEESNIKKLYAAIGKAYFEAEGDNPDAVYAEICAKINVSRQIIESNKARIAELKEKPETGEEDAGEAPEEAPAEAPAEEAPKAPETGE